MTALAKPATVPQAEADPKPSRKRKSVVRVTVLLPRKTYRNVLKIMDVERRHMSPACVLLIERGIASPITAANAGPAPPLPE